MRLAISLALVLAATTGSRQGCGSGGPAPYAACAGKACGTPCTLCAPDDRDCVETAVVKACDPLGRCVSRADGMCAAQGVCAGKACGDPCVVEPPCRLAMPPCMMPSFAGFCAGDGGACLPAPPACPPGPAPSWGCVGKVCGDSCGYCPPDHDQATCPVPTFAPTACDAQLQCVTEGTFACAATDPCAGKKCGESCDRCGGMCMNPVATWCDAAGACGPAPVSCGP